MPKLMTAAALTVLVAVSIASAYGATGQDYKRAYHKAVQEHNQALSLGNGWTTTADVFKQAEAAAADGHYDKAQQLSRRAYQLAKQAVAQAREQRTVWKQAVPR